MARAVVSGSGGVMIQYMGGAVNLHQFTRLLGLGTLRESSEWEILTPLKESWPQEKMIFNALSLSGSGLIDTFF